jgi:hypothetical protein
MSTLQIAVLGISLSWVPSVILFAVLLWREERKRGMKSRLRAD